MNEKSNLEFIKPAKEARTDALNYRLEITASSIINAIENGCTSLEVDTNADEFNCISNYFTPLGYVVRGKEKEVRYTAGVCHNTIISW